MKNHDEIMQSFQNIWEGEVVTTTGVPMFTIGGDAKTSPKEQDVFSHTVTAERILGVVMNDELVSQVDEALPLLLFIIRQCGDGLSCNLVSTQYVKRFNVHRNTFNTYSSKLQKLGLIAVTGHKGSNGTVMTLNLDVIKPLELFSSVRQEVDKIADLTSSLRQMNEHMAAVMFEGLAKARAKVA